MLKWLAKPWCQKLSKFSRDRPTDGLTDQRTDRPTDMTTPRSSDPELKNIQHVRKSLDDGHDQLNTVPVYVGHCMLLERLSAQMVLEKLGQNMKDLHCSVKQSFILIFHWISIKHDIGKCSILSLTGCKRWQKGKIHLFRRLYCQ